MAMAPEELIQKNIDEEKDSEITLNIEEYTEEDKNEYDIAYDLLYELECQNFTAVEEILKNIPLLLFIHHPKK